MDEQKNKFFQANEREEPSTTEYFDFADAVERARKGEKDAVDVLYRKSAALLEWEIRKEYDRPEDVEDMLQESYLRIFKSLDQLKDPNRFLGWAAVICRRTVLEHKTRKDRIEQLVDYWPETSEAGEPSLDLLPADEYRKDLNPDAHVDAATLSEAVDHILGTLPDIQRMCLILWMSGYKYQEIADELGVPLGTVKGNMSRAKKKVTEALEQMRKEGTFDYNEVASEPFAAFLRLLEEYIAKTGTAPMGEGLGDVLPAAGKLASLSRKSSTAVLSLLMVLVLAVGIALGIQSRSPEMTAESGPRETTRVTQSRTAESTTSTTAPAEEGPANNTEGPTGPAATVTARTPAPANPNGGANAGGTNTTSAVVQQAEAGNGGPLTAQVVDISEVPGGNLFNNVAGLGSDIADNVTIRTPVIDSDIVPLNNSDSENIKLYFYVRNHMGQPIAFKGYKEVSIKAFSGKEILHTRIVVNQPIRMENNDESWFVFNIPRNQYQFDPLDRVSLERGWFTTTFKEDYTIFS